jgi:hypothetical protein
VNQLSSVELSSKENSAPDGNNHTHRHQRRPLATPDIGKTLLRQLSTSEVLLRSCVETETQTLEQDKLNELDAYEASFTQHLHTAVEGIDIDCRNGGEDSIAVVNEPGDEAEATAARDWRSDWEFDIYNDPE